ncbi:MAG: insulinase family protein, partial [bacterium]|nr:insulinase family protein [bacterium]
PVEPAQSTGRTILVPMKIEGSYFDLGFHTPSVTHADTPALDVMAHILGGGHGSRLERIVKEKKGLVSSIYGVNYSLKHPGLFLMGGLLRDNRLEETLAAIGEELTKLQTEPVSLGELEGTKENLESSRIYERETVEGIARKLGFFEGTAGDYRFEETYYAQVRAVTAEQIQQVCLKYFSPEKMTAALCFPEKLKGRMTAEKFKKGAQTGFRARKVQKPKTRIVEDRLPNGVRLIFRENRSLPIVAIHATALGGVRFEKSATCGLNTLLSSVWTKETVSRTTREIAEQSEAISGHFSASGGRNSFGLRGAFLSSHLAEGMQLFTELLLHPTFSESHIEKEKKNILAAIKSNKDSLPSVAFEKFQQVLYPHHPYGLPLLGTESSIRSLNRQGLKNYYQKYLAADNLIIAVSGDFNAAEIKERLGEKLSQLPRRHSPFPKLDRPKPP